MSELIFLTRDALREQTGINSDGRIEILAVEVNLNDGKGLSVVFTNNQT